MSVLLTNLTLASQYALVQPYSESSAPSPNVEPSCQYALTTSYTTQSVLTQNIAINQFSLIPPYEYSNLFNTFMYELPLVNVTYQPLLDRRPQERVHSAKRASEYMRVKEMP